MHVLQLVCRQVALAMQSHTESWQGKKDTQEDRYPTAPGTLPRAELPRNRRPYCPGEIGAIAGALTIVPLARADTFKGYVSASSARCSAYSMATEASTRPSMLQSIFPITLPDAINTDPRQAPIDEMGPSRQSG